MNFLHLVLYLLLGCGVAAFNCVNLTYIPYLVNVVFLTLTVLLLASGFILRAGVSVTILNSEEEAGIGKDYRIDLRVTNRSFLPLTGGKIKLEILYTQTGRRIRKTYQTICPAKGSHDLSFTIRTEHCEVIRCRIKKIYLYDYLRIFRFGRNPKLTKEIPVLPELPTVEIKDRIRKLLTEDENAVYSTTKPGEDPTEIFGIREYEGGDRLRNIHWKATAKVGELMVKDHAMPLREKDSLVIDFRSCKDKDLKLRDEFFGLLYGLTEEMIACGYGFTACYLQEEYVTRKVTNRKDLSELYRELLQIKAYEDKKPSAAEIYYENNNERVRVFYLTNKADEAARLRMLLLEETGPVYIMIPGLTGDRIQPIRFTGEGGDYAED